MTETVSQSNTKQQQKTLSRYVSGRYAITLIGMVLCVSVFYQAFKLDLPSTVQAPSAEETALSDDLILPRQDVVESDAVVDQPSPPNIITTPSFKVAESEDKAPKRLVDEILSPEEQARRVELAKQAAESEARASEAKLRLLESNLAPDRAELESLSKVEVSYAVEQWRSAWSQGDFKRYLNSYSGNFKPQNNIAFDAWKLKREKKISPSNAVALSLSDFKVSFNELINTGTVDFEQRYESGSFTESIRKKLVLVKEPTGWKIISETQLK